MTLKAGALPIGSGAGMLKTMPISSTFGSAMSFASINVSTLISYCRAMLPSVSPACTMYWTESCLGVGRIRSSSGVAVNAGCSITLLGIGEMVSGTRVGVGSRVAVGEVVAVLVKSICGVRVSFSMGRNGSYVGKRVGVVEDEVQEERIAAMKNRQAG